MLCRIAMMSDRSKGTIIASAAEFEVARVPAAGATVLGVAVQDEVDAIKAAIPASMSRYVFDWCGFMKYVTRVDTRKISWGI